MWTGVLRAELDDATEPALSHRLINGPDLATDDERSLVGDLVRDGVMDARGMTEFARPFPLPFRS